MMCRVIFSSSQNIGACVCLVNAVCQIDLNIMSVFEVFAGLLCKCTCIYHTMVFFRCNYTANTIYFLADILLCCVIMLYANFHTPHSI